MAFTLIDRAHWPRREYFDHYFDQVPCSYSMTTELDITPVRAAGRKLYPALLHALSLVVNRHPEFRTALDREDRLGVYDQLHPSYTVFHPDTETFSVLWTPFSPDWDTFLASYQRDQALYGSVHRFTGKPDVPENCFSVSMLPWETFQGFHLHLQQGHRYLLPIFTLGRYRQDGPRQLLPLAVQVHHAVCDGFHLCRFLEELREELAACGECPK